MVLDLQPLGITQLTPMQQQMQQAFAASERDIILLSPTGSGKTLAYLLPLLRSLDPDQDAPQALVIVPTRELAQQTYRVARAVSSPIPHSALLVTTPGSLLRTLRHQPTFLEKVHTLVLDEFDKCLETSFQQQLHDIICQLPALRRRILLSATDRPEIPHFVAIHNALRLDYLSAGNPHSSYSITVKSENKLQILYAQLAHILTTPHSSTIVFLNHREAADRTAHTLRRRGLPCEPYHGALPQNQRERALVKFLNGSSPILITTDLASRGLDFPAVTHIIHYDLPTNAETMTHRNGRAVRREQWADTSDTTHRKPDDIAAHIYYYVSEQDEQSIKDKVLITKEQAQSIAAAVPLSPLSFVSTTLSFASHFTFHAPHFTTLYIGKGRQHRLSRGDILGFLCKVGQLQVTDIGRIDVLESCSYVAIPRAQLPDLLQRLEGQKIKGLHTIFREAH